MPLAVRFSAPGPVRTRVARLIVYGILSFAVMLPSQARAQTAPPPEKASHWGVSASLTPHWSIAEFVQNLLAGDDEQLNFEGRDFTVGMVRGSRHGGDWGVSYVRKPFRDGVASRSFRTNCFQPGGNLPQVCPTSNEQNVFDKVVMSGVEVHWFISFVRIKDRVQVGLNVAGGVASVSGTVVRIEDRQEPVFTPRPGGGTTITLVPVHTEESQPAADYLLPVFPLGKVELQGSVILSPSLKVKIGGGLNFPGTGFRVLGVYLFGAK